MKKSLIFVLFSLMAMMVILGMPNGYAASTLPSVSVSAVTVTSPVLRSTPTIVVSATVTPAFDANSGPTSSTDTSSCNNGNSFCGTNNNTVKSKKVVTTTTTTVNDKVVEVSAADGNSIADLIGTPFTGSLTTPTTVSDGAKTVIVTANVSENLTTCTQTDTSYWNAANGGGTQVGSTTTVGPTCDNGTSKTGLGSANGSYILDINPPVLTLRPIAGQPSVLQGNDKNIHNILIGGSELTPYTLTDTVTGPGGYTITANGNGTFGQSPHNDGIANDEHDLVGVKIACDAPIGIYTATAVANTVDLGLNAFPQISSVDTAGPPQGYASDEFTVNPGIFLEDQTQMVSELPPSGDYAPMSCFTSGTSGRKVTTFPGSLHVTATVNTTGPCAGFGTISGTVITLTVPAGFSFDTTGASPAAHVFVGPAAGGFDFHNPSTLTEVTTLIPKPVVNKTLGTVTVDLSTLGDIPSSDTIYVRAHAKFSGTSAPADGTQYVFTTSTTSTLPGIGSTTSDSSGTLTASSACVNGN